MSIKDDLELNTPRRTPNHATKSHVVKTRVDGKDKMIRFGEQGASTAGKPKANDSAKTKAKRKSFKARHASNIAKGPASAAYWANKVKWADGGTVSGPSTMTDVGLDAISGFAGPIISSGISLGNQAFTDKPLDQLMEEKAYVDDMLNYSPRTEQGQAINEGFMDAASSGMQALANKYNELDAQDPDREGLGMYDPVPAVKRLSEKYDETFTDRTKFAISNLFTAGELISVAPVIALVNRAQRVAAKVAIDDAAANVPGPEAYDLLRERLEETGALQLKEIDVPFSKEDLAKSFKDGKITAYGRRIARSASAKQMAEQLPEIKALSEILGNMNILDQNTKMFATQSDRTGTIDGAGPGYPFIGRQYNKMSAAFNAEFGKYPVSRMLDSDGNSTDYPVWAVDGKSTSTMLINNIKSPDSYGSQPDIKPDGTLIIPMIGATDQLRTNIEVFKNLKKAWFSSAKQNNLTPEQREKININLEALTGEKKDILDPETWASLETTFDGRGVLADIMSGKKPGALKSVQGVKQHRQALNKQRLAKGLEPLDLNPVTVPLGSRQGQIFDYEKILLDSTEPSLVGAPTMALGPTIIRPTLDRKSQTIPDAHPGFKEQIMGEAASDRIFEPVPFEVGMPNFDQYGRELFEAKKKEKLIPENRQWGPREYGMNARLGYSGKGLPSQTIDEEYLKHLQSMGYAEGGGVSFDTDDSTILALGDIGADFVSGVAGPVISSAASLSDQFFTDKTIEELKADNIRYNEALNYNPRTSTGRDVNQAFTGAMSEGMQALARKYEENKDNLGPIPEAAEYIGDRYGELDERTRFGLENAFTVGEVVPVAAGASALKRAARMNSDRPEAPIRLDPDRVAINEAADRAVDADYSDLQEMYEAMGARQLSTKKKGGNWPLDDGDSLYYSPDTPKLSPELSLYPINRTPILRDRSGRFDADFIRDVAGRRPIIKVADQQERQGLQLQELRRQQVFQKEIQEGWEEYEDNLDGYPDMGPQQKKEVFNKWVKQNYPKAYDLALSRQQPGSVELNDWIKKKLVGYVKNDLSTAGDPILKMANDGESIHSLDPFNRDEYAGLGDLDTPTWGEGIHNRKAISLDAKTDLAKAWEVAADYQLDNALVSNFIDPSRSGGFIDGYEDITGNQWLKNAANQNDSINYVENPMLAENLNFDHLVDELSNSLDPDSGLPEKLMIDKDKLVKMTVPQASKHVAKVNAWRQGEIDKELQSIILRKPKSIDEDLDISFTESGKGGRWVELPDTMESSANMKTCKAVGGEAGWCTKQEGYAQSYGSEYDQPIFGPSPAFLTVLLDADARPHVQINTVKVTGKEGEDLYFDEDEFEIINEIKPPENSFDVKDGRSQEYIRRDPEYREKLSRSTKDFLNETNRSTNLAEVALAVNQEDLKQFDLLDLAPFRGGNRIPITEGDQSLQARLGWMIDRGDFGGILQNHGLRTLSQAKADLAVEATDMLTTQGRDAMRFKEADRFVSVLELADIVDKIFSDQTMWNKNSQKYPNWSNFKDDIATQKDTGEINGMSRGGLVSSEYNPERINLMAQEILADGYAKGGSVTYNPERINRMAELILQEA